MIIKVIIIVKNNKNNNNNHKNNNNNNNNKIIIMIITTDDERYSTTDNTIQDAGTEYQQTEERAHAPSINKQKSVHTHRVSTNRRAYSTHRVFELIGSSHNGATVCFVQYFISLRNVTLKVK
jgi:hypothetical protein